MKNSKRKKTKKENQNVLILLGPPGSGKGTQAKLLMKKFGFSYFGSGDALRRRQKINDFTGRKLIEVMNKGDLVPSFVISKLWMDKFENFKKGRRLKGFILDGSPRKLIEAKFLDEALEWYQWSKTAKVLFIYISRKESLDRLTKRRICKNCFKLFPWVGEYKYIKRCDRCGGELVTRPDDKIDSIKRRLEEFKKETFPVINHYKKEGKLIKINGEQTIEDVFEEILKKLKYNK